MLAKLTVLLCIVPAVTSQWTIRPHMSRPNFHKISVNAGKLIAEAAFNIRRAQFFSISA